MEKAACVPDFHKTLNNERTILELVEQFYSESPLKEIVEKLLCLVKENKTYQAMQQYNALWDLLEVSPPAQELKNLLYRFSWHLTPDGLGGFNLHESSGGGSSGCGCCDCCNDGVGCCEDCCKPSSWAWVLLGGVIGLLCCVNRD